MANRLRHDSDADLLTVLLKDKGKLSHAGEVGDDVLQISSKGNPVLYEVLNASKGVLRLAQAMASGEAVA
jgi:uncharacterized protein YuzE